MELPARRVAGPVMEPGARSALAGRLRELLPVVLAAGAVWPVWGYLYRAYTSPGADPAGPLVLLGAATVALAGWTARTPAANTAGCPGHVGWWAALLLVLYAGVYPQMPALARAALGLSIIGITLLALPGAGWRGRSGLFWLLVLGAPWADSLSFFLGGPLRAASAHAAAALLGAASIPARVEAASLSIGSMLVSVDAPCAGVNGLWSGLVVAAAVAVWRELSPGRTLLLLGTAGALCVPANGWRAASLVYWEWLGPRLPEGWADGGHSAIGLLTFGASVGVILLLSLRLRRKLPEAVPAPPSPCRPTFVPLLAASCAAALVPLLPTTGQAPAPAAGFPGWPEEWCGQPLVRLPESAMDRRWAAASPGPLARFTLPDGGELLLRWVERPSRLVHPAEDCYRGSGYEVSPLKPVRARVDGAAAPVTWRRFRAERGGESLAVRGLILSTHGETYPDPAWWWWKVAGPGARDPGPWWVVTIREP